MYKNVPLRNNFHPDRHHHPNHYLSSNRPVIGNMKKKKNANHGCHQTYMKEKKIVGYYPGWASKEHPVTQIDASKLTHINYAFASIKDAQLVMRDNPAQDVINFNELNQLKQKHPHLKTLIAIGGWDPESEFSDVASTARTREIFSNHIVTFIRQYGFDGVDIDWEYPVNHPKGRKEDKQNFTLLLEAIRKALDLAGKEDNKTYLLTAALGASTTHLYNIEAGKIVPLLDWFNLMTYDYNGFWQKLSGHNAPLFLDPADFLKNSGNVATTVQEYMNAQVPPSKILLGIPFYGRGWEECCPFGNGQFQYCNSVLEGKKGALFPFYELSDSYINRNGYKRHWNDNSKVPYLYNPNNCAFISYDDEESISYKLWFLKQKCLAGAMIWELSQDKDGRLLKLIHNQLYGSV